MVPGPTLSAAGLLVVHGVRCELSVPGWAGHVLVEVGPGLAGWWCSLAYSPGTVQMSLIHHEASMCSADAAKIKIQNFIFISRPLDRSRIV